LRQLNVSPISSAAQDSSRRHQLGKPTLLAVGAGTSIASVCILGLVAIHQTVPGVWALAAVAVAFAICRLLANVFAHLVSVVPSGAGMFAFISRVWGPTAGMFFIAPYVMLMILLGATESLIVGHLLQQLLPVSAVWLAVAFLVISWLICVMGVRLGFGLQALATWLLVAGVLVGCTWLFQLTSNGAATSQLSARLFASPPGIAAFASAIGQTLFLFMGFELLVLHIESTSSQKIAWALKATVALLAIFYSLTLLALSSANPIIVTGKGIADLLPRLDLPLGAYGNVATLVAVSLCMLAALTSLNGSFMGLSRLIAVMGNQRVLPRALATIHMPSFVPRRAVTLLLLACVASVVVIDFFSIYRAVIFAAAIAATSQYAVALLISERPPFKLKNLGETKVSGKGWVKHVVAALLVVVAIGVFADAGESMIAVLALVSLTYGAGWLASMRLRHQLQKTRMAAAGASASLKGTVPHEH
jgi:amino acid transporter